MTVGIDRPSALLIIELSVILKKKWPQQFVISFKKVINYVIFACSDVSIFITSSSVDLANALSCVIHFLYIQSTDGCLPSLGNPSYLQASSSRTQYRTV